MIRIAATSALALLFVAACGNNTSGTDMGSTHDMKSADMGTPPDMTFVPPTFSVPGTCTPATVNLTTAYAIFNTNCAVSNCHAAGSGNILPTMGPNDMTAFRNNIVNKTANRMPASLDYVKPSDLDNSFVAYKITGQQDKVQFGGAQMPNGLAPLSATDQCTIINWIRSGAN